MSNYLYADIGSTSELSLSAYSLNRGDSNLYFRIYTADNYVLSPGSYVRAIFVPSGITTLSEPIESYSLSGLLVRLRSGKTFNDNTYGIFSAIGGENNSSVNDYLSFNEIKITDYSWENTNFNLHWITVKNSIETYGSISGIWSYPHNVQNNEIQISGSMSSSGNLMNYSVKWNSINNEGSTEYGSSPSDGPYKLTVTNLSDHSYASGFSDWIYYPSGTMSSGIYFSLPFNDERLNFTSPAMYNFHIANVSASSNKNESNEKIIEINHQKFIDNDNFFKNLDSQVFTSPDISKLQKVGEIKIDKDVINRRRLSIGINDISVNSNKYLKNGTYISKYYPLDFNIYTFSLKVIENIPTIENINPYELVKYYIEFNSIWEPISPINRNDEYLNGALLPKLYIFDKGENTSYIKYIENPNIATFRVKILFDMTLVNTDNFVSPEIIDYKCLVLNKEKVIGI